jgi:hypothetical protein
MQQLSTAGRGPVLVGARQGHLPPAAFPTVSRPQPPTAAPRAGIFQNQSSWERRSLAPLPAAAVAVETPVASATISSDDEVEVPAEFPIPRGETAGATLVVDGITVQAGDRDLLSVSPGAAECPRGLGCPRACGRRLLSHTTSVRGAPALAHTAGCRSCGSGSC